MPAVDLTKYGLTEPPDDPEELARWNRDVLIQILANTEETRKLQEGQQNKIDETRKRQNNCPMTHLNSWWKVLWWERDFWELF